MFAREGYTNMLKSGLSITYRVEMLKAGLLSESGIRDLISDALAQNMTHLLPKDLAQYGEKLVKAGKLEVPES